MKLNNNCGSLQTDTSFLSKCAISPSRLQKVENANKLGAWETLSQTKNQQANQTHDHNCNYIRAVERFNISGKIIWKV